jgi:hypothetical protein
MSSERKYAQKTEFLISDKHNSDNQYMDHFGIFVKKTEFLYQPIDLQHINGL